MGMGKGTAAPKGHFSRLKLAEMMKERGLSAERLAKQIGTSRQTVHSWLSGAAKPNFALLVNLCTVLGCDLFELADIPDSEEAELRPFETPMNVRRYVADILNEYDMGYCIEVRSDYASRVFPKGCYALVDPQQDDPIDHSIYAISIDGQYPVFARVEKLAAGMELNPWSHDPTLQPIIVDYTKGGQANVLGKCVWFFQPLENIE